MSAADALHVLGLALPLAAAVLLFGWWLGRRKLRQKERPGQLLRYAVPGQTAAACRGALGRKAEDDIFAYELEAAPAGGWYLHFTGHRPTEQQLDTLFLLNLWDEEDGAVVELKFAREAFGMREPVIGEALLDEFFVAKLGAVRQG